jgi:type VI secretion system secreted protein VgrG
MLTQKHRSFSVMSSLGDDVLLFRRMTAREQISRPFEYELQMLSENGEIKLQDILGKPLAVRLDLPDQEEPRYFNGYVSHFRYAGLHGRYHAYEAILRPWLWLLTRTADCRIFQEMKTPDIIRQVFTDFGFTDCDERLSGQYRQREYCVQYRETAFSFVSRLMEEDGMYYFFEHEQDKHTLVLADGYSSHETVAGYEEIPYFPPDQTGRRERDHIDAWSISQQVRSGVYALDDFDFKAPKKNLRSASTVSQEHAQAGYELFDYPGRYETPADGENYAKIRIQEEQAPYEIAHGQGNARGLSVGALFTFTDYPREDQNREYLVLSATHRMQTNEYESDRFGEPEEHYECHFSTMESKQPYRPPRATLKPVVQGPQTAMVVGKAGEEIWTDKYGRVKCQFHWDRYGTADERSSCWIRVAQSWAGKRWGVMFLPRIGQEVIVDFLEGDPDRPIVTGRVYNGNAMPPYGLPGNATLSTLKSLSSKGGGGFNEIRFEDKKGSEEIFIHAEKDQHNRVKNDALEWVGRDRHLIIKRDRFDEIQGDQHLSVTGDLNQKINGTLSLQTGMDLQEKVGMKHGLEAGMEIHLKAGMNVVIEAGMSITLKAGGGFVVVGPAGVTISGMPVLINSGGAAGSGSGCSPDAPKPPKEATTGEPGAASEPLTRTAAAPQPAPGASYQSAQARALADAARDGKPFCEKCEAARQAAQQGG